MDAPDTKRLRSLLEESKRHILAAARRTLLEESTLDSDDLPDEMDQASSEHAHSLVYRLRHREKLLLAKIEKALERLEDGSFGICEDCGEAISPKRLAARPMATLCIDCERDKEQRERLVA
ncbi:MAG TPA: TraR/DksA C4-type zinc finger protein [Anaeromyxobacteraceae bacterium]|nr:TraR/DksA C4-type zinc finger protein [Anaeromyxobacteraceae bacterium]